MMKLTDENGFKVVRKENGEVICVTGQHVCLSFDDTKLHWDIILQRFGPDRDHLNRLKNHCRKIGEVVNVKYAYFAMQIWGESVYEELESIKTFINKANEINGRNPHSVLAGKPAQESD